MAAAIRLSQQHSCSLDHLVGEHLHGIGDNKSECLRGLYVDDKLELGWLLNRQVGRLLAIENAPDVNARLPRGIISAGTITHEAARHSWLTIGKAGRKRVKQRQLRDATGMIVEKRIAQNEEGIRLLLPEIIKSFLYLGFSAGVHEADLRAERLGRLLCFLHLELRIGVLRVHESRETPRTRSELVQQTQALSGQQVAEECRPSDIPARPAEAGNQPVSGRVAADGEYDRDGRRRPLGGERCDWRAGGD